MHASNDTLVGARRPGLPRGAMGASLCFSVLPSSSPAGVGAEAQRAVFSSQGIIKRQVDDYLELQATVDRLQENIRTLQTRVREATEARASAEAERDAFELSLAQMRGDHEVRMSESQGLVHASGVAAPGALPRLIREFAHVTESQ